jgi:hypothetical protein
VVDPGTSIWAPLQAAAHGLLRISPVVPGEAAGEDRTHSMSGAIDLEVEQSPALWAASRDLRAEDGSHVLTMCCDHRRGNGDPRAQVGGAGSK